MGDYGEGRSRIDLSRVLLIYVYVLIKEVSMIELKMNKRFNASKNKCIAFRVPSWHTWIYVYYDVVQRVIFLAPESEVFVNNSGEIQNYDDGDFAAVDFNSDEKYVYPIGTFYKAARLVEKAGLITGPLDCGTTEMNRYRSC